MEAIFFLCGAGGPQLKRNPLGRDDHYPMAAWQFDLAIVPQRLEPVSTDEAWASVDVTANWESLISDLLPPARSWNPVHLRTWGAEDSHRLDAWVEDGRLHSLLLRIDARREDAPDFCSRAARLANSLGAVFQTPSGRLVEPSPSALKAALEDSAAMRFVRDPELFLKRTSEEGYSDD